MGGYVIWAIDNMGVFAHNETVKLDSIVALAEWAKRNGVPISSARRWAAAGTIQAHKTSAGWVIALSAKKPVKQCGQSKLAQNAKQANGVAGKFAQRSSCPAH